VSLCFTTKKTQKTPYIFHSNSPTSITATYKLKKPFTSLRNFGVSLKNQVFFLVGSVKIQNFPQPKILFFFSFKVLIFCFLGFCVHFVCNQEAKEVKV